MKLNWKLWFLPAVCVFTFAAVAVAEKVDQGAPGNQGLWKVTASQAIPTGYDLVYATTFNFTNCASGGSASQSISAGTYMLVVLTEEVTFCHAATCATGGRRLPAGTILTMQFDSATTVSCRSSGSTGDLEYTKLK